MGQGERCPKCGHVVPLGVKQRCITDGAYCETPGVDGADIASSSPRSPHAGSARRPRPARARKPARKKARR